MKRREFITLVGGTVIAWPLAARAQQPAKMPTVGLISPLTQAAAAGNVAEFRRGLRDLGYVEGRNIALDLRFADGIPERLPELAASLVAAKPDVIFVGSSAGIVATQKATQTIPLIMITLEDPIALGLIKSLARPGTNITGMAWRWRSAGRQTAGNTEGPCAGNHAGRRIDQSTRPDRCSHVQAFAGRGPGAGSRPPCFRSARSIKAR